jgi:hypothetical protein
MTLHELKAYRLALREKLRQLDGIHATCQHCEHFAVGACDKFGATPPEEFQRTPDACAEWQYDEVPF